MKPVLSVAVSNLLSNLTGSVAGNGSFDFANINNDDNRDDHSQQVVTEQAIGTWGDVRDVMEMLLPHTG